MSVDGIRVALCVLGAFYAFAGYVASRAALTSYFVDQAIAAIGGKKASRQETAQSYWLLSAATLILAGGVSLMFLLDIAAWLFLASALGQALYLFYVAPRFFDEPEGPDAAGRRRSTNAFVVYLVATALVVWALSAGKLMSWQEAGWPLLAVPAAVMAAHLAYVVRTLAGSPRSTALFPSSQTDADPDDPDAPVRDPAESKRIKIMADYYTHPLWALDDGLYGDFAPEDLAISPELAKDLNAWAEAFTASLDPADPAISRWSEAEREAHDALARPLAVRLARELPDRMIYIMGPGTIGVIEVKADDAV